MIEQRGLLAIALVAGLIAGGLYYLGAQRTSVVVAARDLTADRPLGDEDLALRAFPADAVPNGAARAVAEAVGKVPRAPLWAGQVVLTSALADAAAAFHSGLVPSAGQRAIAIPVSAGQALGGAIAPGAHVDVIAVPAAGRAPAGRVTEMVARDATVLDVRGENGGAFLTPGTPRGPGIQSNERLGSVVVALPPGDELRVADRIATSTFVLVFIPVRR
ncbi:MAG TPA: Flp pilus assembly protein CpaB [Candidatus Limnocylindria bacterium]